MVPSIEHITTTVLRHEGNLRKAEHNPTELLRAWHRACTFLREQLSSFKVFEGPARSVCLRLLLFCQSCSTHLEPDTRHHQATLQYHFLRRLHERQDLKLVIEHGLGLLEFLLAQGAQPWVEQLHHSCLTAIVSATCHEALKPSQFCECALKISLLSTRGAAQLARSLILAHTGQVVDHQLSIHEATAAFELLKVNATTIKDPSKVFTRLVQSCSDSAVEYITEMIAKHACEEDTANFLRSALVECTRRPRMFRCFRDSSSLVQSLFVSQVVSSQLSCGSWDFLLGLSDVLFKMKDGMITTAQIAALEVSLTNAAATLATDAIDIYNSPEGGLKQHTAARLLILLQAARIICGSHFGDDVRHMVQQLRSVLSAVSGVVMAACKCSKYMSNEERVEVHIQAHGLLGKAMELSEGVLVSDESSRNGAHELHGCLRRISSVMYNSALDMRDEGNINEALGLLRTSLSALVALAGASCVDGEHDWNSSHLHDALKRCSLGLRLVPEQNLLEQGSLVCLLLLVGQKAKKSRRGHVPRSVWMDALKAIKIAASHMADLQKLVQIPDCVDPSLAGEVDVEISESPSGSANSIGWSDGDTQDAQQWLEAHQALCRITSCVHAFLSVMLTHESAPTEGFLISCIPAILDMRAISTLAGNSTAAAHCNSALLSCLSSARGCDSGHGDLTGHQTKSDKPDHGFLEVLTRLTELQHRDPLSMVCGTHECCNASSACGADWSDACCSRHMKLCCAPECDRGTARCIRMRAEAALKLHDQSVKCVQQSSATVLEVSVAAAELRLAAECLAACADELCAIQQPELRGTAVDLDQIRLAFGVTEAGREQGQRVIVMACCQRMRVLAGSSAESSCRAMEMCMQADHAFSEGPLSMAGCGRWCLSLQQAQSALLAVRFFQDLGFEQKATRLRKQSGRFLAALQLHFAAQLVAAPPHLAFTRLQRFITLAGENSCPALAVSVAVHAAAVALQASEGSCVAPALAGLDESASGLPGIEGGGADPCLLSTNPVSVDTISAWEALEEPLGPSLSHDGLDSTQISCLTWCHRQHILAAFTSSKSETSELLQGLFALAKVHDVMIRRIRLRLLIQAQSTLDLGSFFNHRAVQSLLRSSGLGTPTINFSQVAVRQDRSTRGRRQRHATCKAVDCSLSQWMSQAVQLCPVWGNADVFSLLRSLACVCARTLLDTNTQSTDKEAMVLICAPDDAEQLNESGTAAARAALELLTTAIGILPAGSCMCCAACEDLALLAIICGAGAAAFLALQVVSRLPTANAVLMSLLCNSGSSCGRGDLLKWRDLQTDIVLSALHACSEGGKGVQQHEKRVAGIIHSKWPRLTPSVVMVHAHHALDHLPCLLVASYSPDDLAAQASAEEKWTARAAVQVFYNTVAKRNIFCSKLAEEACNHDSNHSRIVDGQSHMSVNKAAVSPLHTALRFVHTILDDSAAGCRRWNAEHPHLTGAEGGSKTQKVLSPSVALEPAPRAENRQQWWDWRMQLDSQLCVAVQQVYELCAASLQHCIPLPKQHNALLEIGDTAIASTAQRTAVEVLLGWDLHCFPWEGVPPFNSMALFRSLPGFHSTKSAQDSTRPCVVDARSTLYVVDPAGDLPGTRKKFGRWFRSIDGWIGTCGAPALDDAQLFEQMQGCELFMFLGHGAGLRGRTVNLPIPAPAALLMGCSSAHLGSLNSSAVAATGPTAAYLAAGSPCVVANLWDVTDRDIDLFTEDMLCRFKCTNLHHGASNKSSEENVTTPHVGETAAALAKLDLNCQDAQCDPDQPPALCQHAGGARRRQRRGGRLQRLAAQVEEDGNGTAEVDEASASVRHGNPSGAEVFTTVEVPQVDQCPMSTRKSKRLAAGQKPRHTSRQVASTGKQTQRQTRQRRSVHDQDASANNDMSETYGSDVFTDSQEGQSCLQPSGVVRKHVQVPGIQTQARVLGTASCFQANPISFAACVASTVQASRGACRLRWLNGAAPVCYGVPTFFSCASESKK